VDVDGTFSGIRFEIEKHGEGRAVLAEIGAKVADPATCAQFTPSFAPGPPPLGAGCDFDTNCGSGTCSAAFIQDVTGLPMTCNGCTVGGSGCDSGTVCGLGDPTSPIFDVPIECVATHARQLGEQCITDDECAGSICTQGMCS